MTLSEIVLYQIPISHFCEKIRWALDYKGLAYRAVSISPFSRRELTRVSGSRQVPVLCDGGNVVSNSSEIVAYLDETYPDPPLVPVKEPERSDCLEIELIADEAVAPMVRRLAYQALFRDRALFGKVFTPPHGAARLLEPLRRPMTCYLIRSRFGMTRAQLAADRAGMRHLLVALQEKLGDHGHFVGGRFTIADIAIASFLNPLEIVDEFSAAPEFRKLFSWARTIRSEHKRGGWKEP